MARLVWSRSTDGVRRVDPRLLETLPGVGPATAAAIVAERDRNGPFLGVDDLERVPGIGPAKLAGLRDLVTA
ncbi:ComEA family DNA-binding protein [uncultured Ilumatobacter sp.]|uniref:ComEA family DNA-binding protein n=1 Tax=uncultured Ilumatobacter sp. TaxID=879968 RepID=UPI00374F047D